MVVRQKALVGKLKKFPVGIQRIFAMSTSFLYPGKEALFFHPYKCQANYQRSEEENINNDGSVYTIDALSHSQTYPQWKVMLDFQKLHSFQKRKQFKRKKIYILPMGTSHQETAMKNMAVGHKPNDSFFDTVVKFTSLFFFGMDVELLEFLNIEQLGFKTRIHSQTNEEQVLVCDVLDYLKKIKQKDCFGIVGWSWLDLYPSPDLNFVLGEACFESGCAVISFGRYSAIKPNVSFDNDNLQREDPLLCEDFAPLHTCRPLTRSPKNDSISFINMSGCSPAAESSLSDLQRIGSDRITLDYGVVWRVIKVLTHEICHLLGMHHCTFFACLMNESNNVYEAEEQPLFLCPICLRKLQKFLQFSVVTRYYAIEDYMEHQILRVVSDTSLSHPLHKFQDCVTWLRNVLIYINSFDQ